MCCREVAEREVSKAENILTEQVGFLYNAVIGCTFSDHIRFGSKRCSRHRICHATGTSFLFFVSLKMGTRAQTSRSVENIVTLISKKWFNAYL
jgi:hypothetical protein